MNCSFCVKTTSLSFIGNEKKRGGMFLNNIDIAMYDPLVVFDNFVAFKMVILLIQSFKHIHNSSRSFTVKYLTICLSST